ncbi:retrovirus-related Pol polyprotein from transposon 17.6 [Halyomorpha halys]|uniref:retrovirus-related Pol polyprotein from transposon 17.6 n=1 Tax=Halyomorpha halys TaxID=286706 RepID=UPI0006D4CEB5|nr:uncharacterized protein LOC106687404 [Halyomorpha halys]
MDESYKLKSEELAEVYESTVEVKASNNKYHWDSNDIEERWKGLKQILLEAAEEVPIADGEKVYSAFEAQGRLYQFKRIPNGVTNGVACFQRGIDTIISDEGLTGVFSYLDDITVCGPDPERLKPLLELPLPNDASFLKVALGLFAHYSEWVPCFSEKISRITGSATFPLGPQAAQDFARLKQEIANSLVTAISGSSPIVIESDTSNVAIATTLMQEGDQLHFFLVVCQN